MYTISDLVEVIKGFLKMNKPNGEMSDEDIRQVCRRAAAYAPDTKFSLTGVEYGPLGIGMMLSISLYEFPWFYRKYELWQVN